MPVNGIPPGQKVEKKVKRQAQKKKKTTTLSLHTEWPRGRWGRGGIRHYYMTNRSSPKLYSTDRPPMDDRTKTVVGGDATKGWAGARCKTEL